MRNMFRRFLSKSRQKTDEADLGGLTRLLRRYCVEQQHVPKDLCDLVSLNYLDAVPLAPPGKRFVIDRKSVEVRLE